MLTLSLEEFEMGHAINTGKRVQHLVLKKCSVVSYASI